MPHQCVRCGQIYDDGSETILKGCGCKGRLFFYIKKEKLREIEAGANLTVEEKKQIEEDIFDLVGSKIDKDRPVVLDFEAIRVLKPGQYELDLVHLFKDEPLIFKLEEGKYMIDLLGTFRSLKNKKKR